MRSCTRSYVEIQELYNYIVLKCCKWSGFGVDKQCYFIFFSASGAGADGCGQNISYILLRRYPYNSSVFEGLSGLRSPGVYWSDL
jgi:hypothetical protein